MADQICISCPNEDDEFKFPSFSEIIGNIEFKFPPEFPDFSSIAQKLNLPSPIFGSINIPNLEMNQVVISFEQFHLTYVINTIWEKVKDLLDSILGMEITLPKIPGLDLDLTDLLTDDGSVVEAIKTAIKDQVTGFMNFLNSLVPDPLLGSLDSPDVDISQKIMIVINGYLGIVITYLANKMSDIKEAAEEFLGYTISVIIPTLPDFPSLDEILDYLKNGISIPPFNFTFPDPLIPNFDSPDMSLSVKLSIVYQEISTYIFSRIGEFLKEISYLIPSIFVIPKVTSCLDIKNPNVTVNIT